MTEAQFERASLIKKEITALEMLMVLIKSWCGMRLTGEVVITVFDENQKKLLETIEAEPGEPEITEKSRNTILLDIMKLIKSKKTELAEI